LFNDKTGRIDLSCTQEAKSAVYDCFAGCCVQGKMMSCGVSLERLHIKETEMMSSSTELNDKDSDVQKPNISQQTCEVNELVDLQATCFDFQKDISKMHKKQGQKMRQDACGVDCTNDGDSSMLSSAELRLTLKKVKVETDNKEDDMCLYVCHTKKPNTSKKLTSKKLLEKCADSNSNTATKDSDILADSGKVIC